MLKLIKNKINELESIIEEYQDQLFSFAFFRVGSYDIAQDIVQDVFLKFFQNKKTLASVENVKTYLFKSISNACMDYKRKYGKIKTISIEFASNNVVDEEKTAEEKMCIAEFVRIEDLMSELSAEQKEVIKLKFVDGLNFVESSKILNVSVNTVKSRYRYGMDKLKQTDKIKGKYYE
ncbi:MAG: RNA polymerase sigma factor [Prevotellaceae bacterium]|jgi:RNA polymerase sigma-70 factor (ECF subfamily)|nr:RNA polymerase sigma factor [Prevotellaceae bacterium]